MANVVVAYILWFFLGIFGVHHFYLKRDRQAFVWWATLGGVCGLGWIRDFRHLSDYVNEANEDEIGYFDDEDENTGYVGESIDYRHYERRGERPKMSGVRFWGMVVMGFCLGYLVMCVFPQEVFRHSDSPLVTAFFFTVPPFAVAVGVHLVANIGRLQASLKSCLVGSVAGIIWIWGNHTNIAGSCFLSAMSAYYWGRTWKPFRRPRRSKCRRLSILFVCGTVYLLMWGSCLYYNATVTTKDGEEVPLRVALDNFFTSPAWTKTKETLYLVWQHIRVNGWRTVFEQIVNSIDPQGETNAYKVLGVHESSSQENIKARYKKLAREWHPDKQKDPAKKAQAQEKFMEIQKAYEILSKIKIRRSEKNQKFSRRDEF